VLSGLCFLDETVRDWKEYLQEPPDAEAQTGLFKATRTGRPCGDKEFVAQLEDRLGRRFVPLPCGRPIAGKNQETSSDGVRSQN